MKVETSNEASAYKSKPGFGRIAKAAGYSVAGLAAAWRHEVAFRQLALLACVLIPVGFMVGSTPVERALLVLPVLTSLAIELVNSAIEAVVDRVSLEIHPLSKRAKDLGSAAQLVGLVSIAVVWLAVLL
ncbi:diacylglycerol kinase [Stutzerimonas kunmingensis]|uniref:Diacylglycerol kinase n=1 Tax=Stutzerimonas stutzeri CCUG 29243 TaxID=1196835 RepID=I4CYQ8_STUST|nr:MULTISPECIES: diacylglycerol kinase [Stutzerimonas stutzeri subgroup]MAG65069.1 diacylglycerol kinase [Pseudomonadales bacterium]MAK88104.1 diacylglycerol kinase [Pseudomonas sp.]MBU0918692.1 diacylglycerol kinase [Gammaproteobacteria bacterium]AFM35215.1 diacylglycerol kinase [Stutzerimonas stutzeri CCUG 29243]MBU2011319.1 diacylglycerol kinase [Gammaproteobacteria bacterium]